MPPERQGRRVGVRFNHPDEWLDELRQDAASGTVERGIARVTTRATPAGNGTFTLVHVVAGYCEKDAGRPVTLEAFVGQDWGEGFELTGQTNDRARELTERLEAEIAELALERRAGAFVEVRS